MAKIIREFEITSSPPKKSDQSPSGYTNRSDNNPVEGFEGIAGVIAVVVLVLAIIGAFTVLSKGCAMTEEPKSKKSKRAGLDTGIVSVYFTEHLPA